MGALMRTFNWAQSPLGPVSEWPQSLKTAVRIILTSRYAMFVWWGQELVNLYNDSYRAFLGVKHPAALGRSARQVWSEIWHQIGPRTDAVLLRGESTFDEALLLLMERHGYLEETYFTFSYSPLPDDLGNIGGLFCAVTEATQQVIGERRLRSLREIAGAVSEGRKPVQVCQAAASCLSNARRDLPFSLIYLLEPDGATLRRAGKAGIAADHPAAPESVRLDDDAASVWPFRQIIETGEAVIVGALSGRFPALPSGEWGRPPASAVLVPIAHHGQNSPAGILVAGLNPHREFDEDFRGFVSLLASQIAGGIVNAVIYEALDADRRRAAQAAEARHKLSAIVESSDDAIVGKDLNGIVTSWNDAAERIFGYTAQEMIGRSITTVIPPELQRDERRILDTIGRGERIEHFETVRLTKSGERIEVSLTISPVKDETGRIIGAAKIARDITQQKKGERAMRITERLASVGRLAATVAHEINNPLEAVMNLVYLAKENAGSEEARRYLQLAEEELDRISQLTKQTLGFYRETKTASLVKLGAMLEPLISVFAARSRRQAIDIRTEIRQDPQIAAVPGEIRQLIANLLSNSIDAVQRGGKIRIRVAAATDFNASRLSGVRLTIVDSGPGIPAAVRSKVFEPFFTTKKEIGTGLGLWVCKSIVENHRGSIRVKSSTLPGRTWTAFSVFLPSSRNESAFITPAA